MGGFICPVDAKNSAKNIHVTAKLLTTVGYLRQSRDRHSTSMSAMQPTNLRKEWGSKCTPT